MVVPQELWSLRADLLSALDRLDKLIAATKPAPDYGLAGLDRTVAIETVLRQAGRPMRPVEIWARLQEHGRTSDPKMEVQVTTYDLWKRGRIEKVSRGLYAAKTADGPR